MFGDKISEGLIVDKWWTRDLNPSPSSSSVIQAGHFLLMGRKKMIGMGNDRHWPGFSVFYLMMIFPCRAISTFHLIVAMIL